MNKQDIVFEKTREALIKKFEDNQWKTIELLLKNSGHTLNITPVAQIAGEIKDLNDAEWFSVYGSPLNTIGGPSLDCLTRDLINYDTLLTKLENDKTELKAFFEENLAHQQNNPEFKTYESEVFGDYSDRHKSLFGFRPRGLTFGQIGA